jgi:hypothetical protein
VVVVNLLFIVRLFVHVLRSLMLLVGVVSRNVLNIFIPYLQVKADGVSQEAYSKRIELKDDEPETVERMISFMYTFDYKDEVYRDDESVETGSEHGSSDEAGEIQDVVEPTENQALPEATESVLENGASAGRDYQSTLFSSVRVYAIADKYDIPGLKELAKQRFCEWAAMNWACEDFPAIAREVFESTPSSDRGLRDFVLGIVTDHADVFIKNDDFLSLVECIGELGLGLFHQLLKAHSDEKVALQSVIDGLESEAAILKQQLLDCQQNLLDKSHELDSTTSKINELDDCRHCRSQFNLELRDDWAGSVIYRCKRCRGNQ